MSQVGRILKMGLPVLGVGSVAYIATNAMMGDPKKAALNDLAKQRVKVSISCCSEWSYLPKAKNLVWALQDEFEEDKENIYYFTDTMNKLINEKDQVKGHFEVWVNSDLVHSKIGGDGFVDSRSKFNKIVKAIEDELEEIKK